VACLAQFRCSPFPLRAAAPVQASGSESHRPTLPPGSDQPPRAGEPGAGWGRAPVRVCRSVGSGRELAGARYSPGLEALWSFARVHRSGLRRQVALRRQPADSEGG